MKWPDLSQEIPRNFQLGGIRSGSMTFSVYTDDDGKVHHGIAYEDANVHHAPAPMPSIGPFLLATSSTVSCQTDAEILSRYTAKNHRRMPSYYSPRINLN